MLYYQNRLYAFYLLSHGDHRLLHSFPTRRSSDLSAAPASPPASSRRRRAPSRASPRAAPAKRSSTIGRAHVCTLVTSAILTASSILITFCLSAKNDNDAYVLN